MSTLRTFPGLSLRSFLFSVAAVAVSLGAVACSASADGASAAPSDGLSFDRKSATFSPTKGGDPTCTRIASSEAKGSACLADVAAMCPSELEACQADCTCATYVNSCLDAKSPEDTATCFKKATLKNAEGLAECVRFASSCHVGPDTLAPGYEREKEKKLPATLRP